MPRDPRADLTGNAFLSRDTWYARVSLGGGQRKAYALPWAAAEQNVEANARAALLARIARDVRATKEPSTIGLLPTMLSDAANASDPKELVAIEAMVDRLTSGRMKKIGAVVTGGTMADTFADVARAWTSGALAKKYPDHVKEKRSAAEDAQRFRDYAKAIHKVPMRSFTLAHAEQVMAGLPADLGPASRRQVAQSVARVVKLAVYPLKLLAANPIPTGWLPRVSRSDQKQQAMPMPSECDQFVACPSEPLGLRLLVGFIAREGMRHEEAEGLTWSDVDLKNGIVRLLENKTDDPRSWALRPGTTRALARHFKDRGSPDLDALVFVNDRGTAIKGRADTYREALLRAGVDRAELHAATKTESVTGFHAIRGLMVTESLARGMTERWISDRTGHASSDMISRYQRRARTFAEAKVPPLGDLDAVLGWADVAAPFPEGGSGPQRVGDENPSDFSGEGGIRTRGTLAGTHDFQCGQAGLGAETGFISADSEVATPSIQPTGSTSDPASATLAALAAALDRASAAGQWAVVAQLAAELQARRLEGSNVVPIAEAKVRRG